MPTAFMPAIVAAACIILAGCAAPAPRVEEHGPEIVEWTTVPTEFDGYYFYALSTINDNGPYRFIVDTGCTVSTVDRALASTLGLPVKTFKPSARDARYSYAPGARLKTGGLGFTPRHLVILPLDGAMSEALGKRIQGILGADFFADHVVELDYQSGTMRVRSPAGFDAGPEDEVIPLFRSGCAWALVTMRPQGQESFGRPLMVDTGFSGSLSIEKRTAERFGMPGPAPTVATGSRTLFGDKGGVVFRLDSADIGSIRIGAPTASVGFFADGSSPPVPQGLLGAEVLRKFTVTFDFARDRLLLRPNAAFADPIDASTTGLGLVAQGPGLDRLVVELVVPDSPASEAGLTPGDAILEVDGRPSSEFSPVSLRRYLQRALDRPVALGILRDGAELECTITPRRRI